MLRGGFGLLVALCCCQCSRESQPVSVTSTSEQIGAESTPLSEPILPVLNGPSIAPERLELGRLLFHETALSDTSRRISCATCHPLDQGGTTGRPPAEALAGETEPYDIPTVYNAADHFAHFWNGRAQNIESVIQTSIRAENLMDGSWDVIVQSLREMPDYVERFGRVYPDAGVTEATIEDALAGFVRSLTTPNAPFDRWLAGEALPDNAQQGYALFKDLGCVRCHQGAGAGGNLFAGFGGYIATRDTIRNSDLGRFNVTNDESHRYVFKVPSLRNVALTAPYFHDGSASTLDEAVRAMALHQAGRTLSDGDTKLLVAFLESLTGSALLSATPGATP